jgi:uncharacterized membrane protein YkvA (DUF1232 family)
MPHRALGIAAGHSPLARLASDHGVPRAVRVRVWLRLGYLAIPIDLVPDFVPVLGYPDDAIVVASWPPSDG